MDNAWAIISPAFEKEIADLSWSKSVPASAEVLKGLNELREFRKQFDDHFPPEKKKHKLKIIVLPIKSFHCLFQFFIKNPSINFSLLTAACPISFNTYTISVFF